MQYNFEEGVEKILHRQRKTKKSLYDALGMTRQGFDSKLKNNTVFVTDIAKMASFFEMSELELFAELANISTSNEGLSGNVDEHLTRLEDKINSLLAQLAVKDRQIDGLQRTVDVLVGKSEGATEEPLSSEEFKQATLLVQKLGERTLANGMPFRTHLVAKLVAPR